MGLLYPILAATTDTPDWASATNSSTGWAADATTGHKYSIESVFDNLGAQSLGWAYSLIGIIGVACIIGAAYLIITGLGHGQSGRSSVSWPLVILLLIVGGIMTFGGWSMFAGTIAAGGAATVSGWGN